MSALFETVTAVEVVWAVTLLLGEQVICRVKQSKKTDLP
jgi:hypothetical protein